MTPATLENLQQMARRASDRAYAYRLAGESALASHWTTCAASLTQAAAAMAKALALER